MHACNKFNIVEKLANSEWNAIVETIFVWGSCSDRPFLVAYAAMNKPVWTYARCRLQITGRFSNFKWARSQVATMQQTCVDDVLMTNYTDISDTQSLGSVTRQAVSGLVSYKCEPFDCHGNGNCINGSCVCKPSTIYTNSPCPIKMRERWLFEESKYRTVWTLLASDGHNYFKF